jgi:hypothetical protein
MLYPLGPGLMHCLRRKPWPAIPGSPGWLQAACCAATSRPISSRSSETGNSDSGELHGSPCGPAQAADPATGLPLSVALPVELRDAAEEACIEQLQALLAAGSGVAADPEVRAAAEAALEARAVCESCSQVKSCNCAPCGSLRF